MTKRIWMKPDCVTWILQGKKTTTFRAKRCEGIHDVVRGSWYEAEKVGLTLRLTPFIYTSNIIVITRHFDTEGPFVTPDEFIDWLKCVNLYDKFPKFGWLHKVSYVSANAKGLIYPIQTMLEDI